MMHGHDWHGQDIRGWYITEKLDGCRAQWTGAQLLSRSGRPIVAPHAITQALPPIALDCEVYAGPGNREAARQAVQLGRWPVGVRLIVFDAPGAGGDIVQRLASVRALCEVPIVPQFGRVGDVPALLDRLERLQASGGEGLMLHRPGARWRPERVPDLLKFKCVDTVCALLEECHA